MWLKKKQVRSSKLILQCIHSIDRQFFNSFDFRYLRELDMRGSAFITSSHMYTICKNAENLWYLNISGSKSIGSISFIVENNRKLLCLEAEDCADVGCCGASSFSSSTSTSSSKSFLTELEIVNLKGCNVLNSAAETLARFNSRLKSLNLSDNLTISDGMCQALAQYCPLLQIIKFGYCSLITDSGITIMAQKCKALQTIDLHYCANITDRSLIAIAENSSEIRHINIRGNGFITDQGMFSLAEECSELLSLDIVFCNRVTLVGIDVLKKLTRLVVIRKRNES